MKQKHAYGVVTKKGFIIMVFKSKAVALEHANRLMHLYGHLRIKRVSDHDRRIYEADIRFFNKFNERFRDSIIRHALSPHQNVSQWENNFL